MRILSGTDVRAALPMVEAIAAMKRAFGQLSAGRTIMPLRPRIDLPEANGVALFMPALLQESGDMAVKIVSVFPDNVHRGEPAIYAAVIVLDAATGRSLALLEGGTLTAIRTGAGSGAATDLLARDDAQSVAILGSGVQARTQLEAVCTVRRITTVRVYSPNTAHAAAFAAAMAGQGPIPDNVHAVASAAAAVRDADIVCTATSASTPVFDGHDLKPGAHVNGVGSFTPEMQEVDAFTVKQALVVVDSHESALAEAGDLLIPIEAGEISPAHIHAELGELVNGDKTGRIDPQQITFFKSCGVAVQDAAAARVALNNAVRDNLGVTVDL